MRSQTPPPPPEVQEPLISTPLTPSLDLDPDDVNARLRLLVNNSYFLPPAHTKPELTPIYLTPTASKGATSPSAFKEFFRVGKKKDKRTELNGYVSPVGKGGVRPTDSLRPLPNGPDRRYGTLRHDPDFQPSVGPTRNRVVVVRETVDNLPPPAIRAPFRTSSLPTRIRPRTAPEAIFIDPTTQYDMPPPTHYPSFNNLRLDAAGLTGNVELDQFAPPGEPWSPAPSSPRSLRGGGMDPQERVWRRALLEQAVDLSLSSAASDPGHASPGFHDESFRGLRVLNDEIMEPTTPKSPKNKKSWWGRKEKDGDEIPPRQSTSSSNKERDVLRTSSTYERATHSLEPPVPSQSAPIISPRYLGQSIVPNVHAELEELERHQTQRPTEPVVGPRSQLRLLSFPFGPSSASAPVTPLYHHQPPGTPPFPMTPLSPRPAYRKSDSRLEADPLDEHVRREFMAGHSTIRKSLSSPLLSDLHETGVEVEEPMAISSSSNDSLNGVTAPSLVLQDPHGITSPVPSNTSASFTSGSHYSEEDDQVMFDHTMMPNERSFVFDDGVSLEGWTPPLSSRGHGDGRPSFDSFGSRRVQSPEDICPGRASSTFGFRRSNISVTSPSPLRGSHNDIEVDISGDPTDHLVLMQSQRSSSPGGDSQASSLKGYASALDHTFHGSGAPSLRPSSRPSSPTSQSFLSTNTRLASINSEPEPPERPDSPEVETETGAPISFFDSVQHQSYIDDDGISSDSDVDMDEPPDVQPTTARERFSQIQTQTLGRKSLNMTRPTPGFAMQFRNASQPQLPTKREDNGPPLASMFHPIQPYDLLDRKKPLTNTPVPTSPTSTGILSQLKKSGKGPRPFSSRSKKSTPSGMVIPEPTFELLRYPHGSAFSLGSGAGAGTGSDTGSAEPGLRGFDTIRSQDSTQSLRSSAAASVQQTASWRQEPNVQNESLRKLDGMVTQHLEAEKDRLRKIATAAKEKSRHRPR